MLLKSRRGVCIVVVGGVGAVGLVHVITEVGLQQEMHASVC